MEDEVEVGNGKSFSDLELITRTIFEISEAVETTKDLEDLYCQVHTIINQYIPAQSFYIALYNPADKSVTFPYYVDNLDSPAKVSQLDNATISVTNYAMEKDNPLLITSKMLRDLIESGEVVKPASSLSQWLGVPLKTLDNNKIGLLAVQNFDKNYKFTDDHKHFLNFISTQIALAIQHKQYVAKLRSEEKKFRSLYESNPLMLFIIDESGKIIDANERAAIDLEYELDELIGKNVSEVFHPEDKEQVRINIKKSLEKREETHKWELRKISKSGKVVWVSERASTLEYTSDQTQLLISCENITEQKISELKLKESENLYRLLTDNIDEMIIMHDIEGNIIFANETAFSLTKLGKKELLNKNVFSLFEGEYNQRITEYITDKGKQNSLYFFEIELDGDEQKKIPLELSVTKTIDRNGKDLLFIVARDVRERKGSEANIRKINEELLKSNYSKDKFFSIIAHDLRSPFNALLSYSDILLEDFEELERSEVKEYISHMNNVSKNIFSLLNNLLEWSQIQTDRYEIEKTIFDINDAIHNVVTIFEVLLSEKNIKVEIDYKENYPVYADQNMISTALRNLLSNAIKFSEDGSSIKIVVNKNEEQVIVSIEDYGIGMLPEDIEKLFRIDINYTTLGTNKEKGTGLGLILSKEMVEKNGGNIFVESRLGEGSKFSFTIPIHK